MFCLSSPLPVQVEPYWPKLFANLCAGRDIGDLLTSGGGSAAPAPAAAAPAAGGAAAPAAKKEEPKEEEEAGEYVLFVVCACVNTRLFSVQWSTSTFWYVLASY